uniref:Cell division control protein 48 n=1 Tax=Amorphochlora amoebiformis TaxID=1561963 RepID=A0A0H5BLW8_9EUKA|nr:cell division control protein 48 [Amorphochlora amoebiformis]
MLMKSKINSFSFKQILIILGLVEKSCDFIKYKNKYCSFNSFFNNNHFRLLMINGAPGSGKTLLIGHIINFFKYKIIKVSVLECIDHDPIGIYQTIVKKLNFVPNNTNCIILITDIDLFNNTRSEIDKSIMITAVENVINNFTTNGFFDNAVTNRNELKVFCKKKSHPIILLESINYINFNINGVPILVLKVKEISTFGILLLIKKLLINYSINYKAILKKITDHQFNWTLRKLIYFILLSYSITFERFLFIVKTNLSSPGHFHSSYILFNTEDINLAFNKCKKAETNEIISTSSKYDVLSMKNILSYFESKKIKVNTNRKSFLPFGRVLSQGSIFYGPPGCGKSMLGLSISSILNIDFEYVKSPAILDKYVGESEKMIEKIFLNAKKKDGALIMFFDEFDSITNSRISKSHNNQDRILHQLLIEMDMVRIKTDLLIIGATNCIETIDLALLRSGRYEYNKRFGIIFFIPMPSSMSRAIILRSNARRFLLGNCCDFNFIKDCTVFPSLISSDIAYFFENPKKIQSCNYKKLIKKSKRKGLLYSTFYTPAPIITIISILFQSMTIHT